MNEDFLFPAHIIFCNMLVIPEGGNIGSILLYCVILAYTGNWLRDITILKLYDLKLKVKMN